MRSHHFAATVLARNAKGHNHLAAHSGVETLIAGPRWREVTTSCWDLSNLALLKAQPNTTGNCLDHSGVVDRRASDERIADYEHDAAA